MCATHRDLGLLRLQMAMCISTVCTEFQQEPQPAKEEKRNVSNKAPAKSKSTRMNGTHCNTMQRIALQSRNKTRFLGTECFEEACCIFFCRYFPFLGALAACDIEVQALYCISCRCRHVARAPFFRLTHLTLLRFFFLRGPYFDMLAVSFSCMSMCL